jgi:formamidopyrimidine-DNA glycosylase
MPELPEVETMKRGLAPILGQTIAAVERPKCALRPIAIEPALPALRRRLVGKSITSLERIGKRVAVVLDGADRLIFEPRMTGLVLLAEPPSREHVRLAIDFEERGAPRLLYWDRRGLGSVRLVTPGELARRFGDGSLGPDALQITAAALQARLGASRRAIKVALLDQRAVAGIGNLYAAEILHLAAIDPRKACSALGTRHWKAIHAATLDILQAAIRHEGSTLGDGTYRNALNREGGYQNHHRVYARAGEACLRCAQSRVRRIVQAQRATFFCPGCQR